MRPRKGGGKNKVPRTQRRMDVARALVSHLNGGALTG